MKKSDMSKDLDKLAAELRKMKPSKQSRSAAMEAAMSAFTDEFLPETAAAKINAQTDRVSEKRLEVSQGLPAEPRPKGQTTRTTRVQTFGRQTMAKFSNLINFKPQTMMMAGTCAAALIAGLIVLPNMGEFGIGEPSVQSASAEAVVAETSNKAATDTAVMPSEPRVNNSPEAFAETSKPETLTIDDVDEIVVTGSRLKRSDATSKTSPVIESLSAEDIGKLADPNEAETLAIVPGFSAPMPKSAPAPQGSINSIDSLLSDIRQNAARTEVENDARVRAFRQRANQQSSLIAPPPPPQAQQRGSGYTAGQASQPQGGLSGALSAAKSSTAATPSGRTRIVLPGGQSSASAASLPEKIAGLTVEQSAPEFKTVTETVVAQAASTELVTIPAEYEIVTETVVVQEASSELQVIPAKYEWVKGDIEGSAVELDVKPAQYKTVSETVVVQEASTELVTIPPTFETVQETVLVRPSYIAADGSTVPPVTKEVARRVIKTPASTQERTIPAVTKTQTRRVVKTPSSVVEREVPYEKKNGKTRVQTRPAATVERAIPAVTKTVKRRVIKTPARTIERVRPSVPQTYERQVLVTPKVYLRDDDGNVVREFESRDAFEIYKANLPTPVLEKPVSTFSVDVDTASYSFLRASINRGKLPPRESIRLEEMINYFPYDYEVPKSADEPFKANVTVTSNPWNADTKLMHIGIKGYVPTEVEKPRNNLVFLIDTSGSMNSANKLPLLKNSFKLLLNTLEEDDTVSIVAYASASGTVLEPTAVRDKSEILAALNNLRAGGSTAGAAGLELAYKNAEENFDDEGNNRVILATDGDFNVGFSSPDDMKAFISKKRDTGISLSVLGFGMGNYNDHLMQSLAQNGNGVAAYIDNLSEAQKVLANEAGSALMTIAKDVKIQVEFNPAKIAEYRLIGYETRALKRQDFNNDKVDAGEIGAGHSVTAIYEMTPVGSPAITVDKLRYVADKSEPETTGSDEYAFVKIRHKLPNADKSTLQTFPIGPSYETSLRRASDDMRFATAVAAVGQKLRGDTPLEDFSYADAIKLAKKAKGEDEHGYRAEFIQMVKLIDGLED